MLFKNHWIQLGVKKFAQTFWDSAGNKMNRHPKNVSQNGEMNYEKKEEKEREKMGKKWTAF